MLTAYWSDFAPIEADRGNKLVPAGSPSGRPSGHSYSAGRLLLQQWTMFELDLMERII